MSLNLYSTPYAKINLALDLNQSNTTILKLLEKYIEEYLCNLGVGKNFLHHRKH